ncbi:MAG: NAD(P)H-dependent oxidoreductase [Steroidobacteraceae bacterium]
MVIDPVRRTVLIVFHSMTDGTRQMAAAAAAAGATAETLMRVSDAARTGPEDLLAADGYMFATPENLGSMSGVMKDFFDRSYYGVLDRIVGRPYASLICAGSDGQGAARQIERICTGLRLKQVAPALIVCTHAQTPEQILRAKHIDSKELARCAEVAQGLAEGLALGIY